LPRAAPAHLLPALQAAWPSGTECIAKYNFHGTAEQDLPFCKGDVLTIVAVTKVTRDLTPPPTTHLWVFAPLQGWVSLRKCLGSPLPRTPIGTKPRTRWAVRASSQPTMSRSGRV